LIVLKVYYQKNRFVYSTGQTIETKYWNNVNGVVEVSKGISKSEKEKHKDINFQINRYENEITKIFRQLEIEEIQPNNSLLKDRMDKVFKLVEIQPDAQSDKKVSFKEFVLRFIEESKITKNKLTVKSYSNTLNLIVQFGKERKYKIDFDTINLAFYHKFVKYLADYGKSINTIGKQVKNLKVFIHSAERRGIVINSDIDNPKFKKLSGETDKIYLTAEDVGLLNDFDLSNKPRLEKIRDLFVIGCNTALRFSDFSIIQKENIYKKNAHKYLRKRMEKGNRIVVVPLNKMVLSILEKYNYVLPSNISNQKMKIT